MSELLALRRLFLLGTLLLLSAPLFAQGKRLWVLRAPGEMVEYDPTTFAAKQTVKVPAEAVKSPAGISVNRAGQMLFAAAVTLPLSDEDIKSPHKVWIWDGHAANTIDLGVEHKSDDTGSNQAVTESAPSVFLSADGQHLFWLTNIARHLEREGVDLSTSISWQAWQTDLAGAGREDLVSDKLPDCRCPTGTCEESCPLGVAWVPESGLSGFFLLNQFVAGQTTPIYKGSTRYQSGAGKWSPTAFPDPLQKVLDASADGMTVVEAIPDTGCCGWSNQSNDQTLVVGTGKKIAVFDEQATYKNSDYDVSFYTTNARLSSDATQVVITIAATAQSNKPIQLAEQGQASPEELQKIHRAIADLPAVAVKTIEDPPKQVAFIPHASLVGWINDKELLIVENHLLVAYNVATGARRKSTVRVDDPSRVFLR